MADAKEHLQMLIDEEDRLSKAKDLETLHYQRGVIAGIQKVLFALSRAN